MRDSGSSHLMPLMDCTKVYGNSDFDIIKNKTRRRYAKEQTQLREDKDAITDDEDVCLIKKMKQAKKSEIEARVKYVFTYVKPYIKKNDGRTDINALRSGYENVSTQDQYVSEAKHKIETIQYINERAMKFGFFSEISSKLLMN